MKGDRVPQFKICMLLDNTLSPDPRVQKEAKALSEAGYDVTIYCQKKESLPGVESLDGFTIRRAFQYKLGTTTKIKKYIQAHRELWRSIKEKYDIYHCHDVPGRLAGTLLNGTKHY
jgi:1,2-diacylglycerol 3-alpha-glucosyltransferase